MTKNQISRLMAAELVIFVLVYDKWQWWGVLGYICVAALTSLFVRICIKSRQVP